MFRKIFMFSVLLFVLSLIASPVLAVNTTTGALSTKSTDVAAKIACVAAAVSVRESTISTAYSTYSAAILAAYSTRANELAGAYSNTTADKAKAGVKVAWAGFNKTKKSANSTWKGSRESAWTVFRSAVSACKSPAGVSDSSNVSSEPKGE